MEEGEAAPARPHRDALPEMTFQGLVLSLSASAMVHLGEAAEGSATEPNLPLARQTIEILELLERKTRGNLDADEQAVLGAVLHELRLKFVARGRA
jgi:hypothetical protein